jgi:hypothetical protein
MKRNLKIMMTIGLIGQLAWAENPLKIKKLGRKPSSELKIKSSLVPTFEIYRKISTKGKIETFKVKNIPHLDIGEERQVQAAALTALQLLEKRDLNLNPISLKNSPPIYQWLVPSYEVDIKKPKILTSANSINLIPQLKPLVNVAPPKFFTPSLNLTKIEELQANDYKLLQALIFLELQKNYELAMGLFAELMDDPEHRIEALYNYAMTAHAMGLKSEFRANMLQVAKESKDQKWQKLATEALVKNIKSLELSDIGVIDPLLEKYAMDVSTNDEYQINRAKYYSEKIQLGFMEDALLNITEKSKYYPEAQLLTALFNYRQGKVEEAILPLQLLLQATESDKTSQLRSVGALTLARIQFQKNRYKDAFQSYLKVDKSSALWLQAMVESAWSQILVEDHEGAAGNMFSLHTDFFKNAFSPESYVVRTVGYLNLCQYGDGAQVLKEMNKKYLPWKKKLDSYANQKTEVMNFYETVKNWIQNSDLKEVDGLPRSFIVELARHPSFTQVQKQINSGEDEIARFNKISLTLIKIERELIKKQNLANKEFAEAKAVLKQDESSFSAKEKFQIADRKLMSYRIQYHIAKKARISIKTLREEGISRLEKEKEELRLQASKALQIRFNELVADLDHVLEQNEVLQYELFSGAGEHIRYQMAGGEVSEKERPELKVEKEKSLTWKFKGEIWEDEVGHYRSSLKNVCPQESKVAGLSEK